MRLSETVFGSFDDERRTYVVTASSMPDTIRVFAGDPIAGDEICTVSNLSHRPYPSWQGRWHGNLPPWKEWVCARAVELWFAVTRPRIEPPQAVTYPRPEAARQAPRSAARQASRPEAARQAPYPEAARWAPRPDVAWQAPQPEAPRQIPRPGPCRNYRACDG